MQYSKSKPIVYSQSTIVGTIDDTNGKHIKTIILKIMNEFDAHLKSTKSAAANSWEYVFECEYAYITALNTEIQKHFDSSVFVRVYGGCVGASSNKLICKVNWGAD